MELAGGGELFDFITRNKRLNEKSAAKFYWDLIDGIEYLHKSGVCHRDIKPENLLLDYDNALKIVDFDLSNMYEKNETLKTKCGSPCYSAPEVSFSEFKTKRLTLSGSNFINRLSLASLTTVYRLTFGLVVSSSMPWSLATYPFRTKRSRTFTKKSWLLITRCPSSFLRSARTLLEKSSTKTPRLEFVFQKSELTPLCVQLSNKHFRSSANWAFFQ